MLELKNICFKGIFKNLNLKVNNGEFVTIVGENGSGKSTLFKVISRTIKPEEGEVLINNIDLNIIPKCKVSSLVSNVLQDPKQGTIEDMTILENLNIAYMRGKTRSLKTRKNLKEIFKGRLSILQMNLEDRLDEYVKNLSGGQRQALSLVMATLSDYEVLLLDEITAALDPFASDLVMKLANKIAQTNGKICISITHDLKYISQNRNKILKLENGQLLSYCT